MPLLGKVARNKRAKSANLRSSAKHKGGDRRKLVKSSSSSETAVEGNDKLEQHSDLDYAEERMKSVKESLRNIDKSAQIRPINIDIALGEEQAA